MSTSKTNTNEMSTSKMTNEATLSATKLYKMSTSKTTTNESVAFGNKVVYKMSNELIKLLTRFPHNSWDWYELSSNPNITWEIVLTNLDKPWSWWWLSEHPNITWKIVLTNLDKPWHWYNLSYNPNITWEIILNNPDKP